VIVLVLLWKSIHHRGAEFAEFLVFFSAPSAPLAVSSFFDGAAIPQNPDHAETVGSHRAGQLGQINPRAADAVRIAAGGHAASYFVKKNIVKGIRKNAKQSF